MKYRVTPRGWFVFSLLGLLILWGLFSIVSPMFDNDTDTSNENSSVVENDDNQTNDIDYSDDNSESVDSNDSMDSDDEVTEDESNENSNETDDESNQNNDESDDNQEQDSETTDQVEITEIDLGKKSQILFDKNIAGLDNEDTTVLNEWLEVMQLNPDLEIIVEGHINGYPYYNDGNFGLGLAEERAQMIIDYFVGNGISDDRFTLINKGSTEQVDKSDDTDMHYLNRRAVIYFNTETTNQ
jgi:outer membrane protein OmpA-like peptidoglycan-associated protein